MSTGAFAPTRFGVVPADERAGSSDGFWRRALSRLLRNRLALAGLIVVAAFGLIGLLAPLVAPQDPMAQDLHATFARPSLHHLMGTDNLGRDWFSRIVYGARVSLTVGVLAQTLVLGIGLPLGLVAGYRGRLTDSLLMRACDMVYAFPELLLVILLRGVLGGSVFTLVAIIGLVSWVDVARLTRGQVLSLKQLEFVQAARSLGASDREVMTRHLLPNLIGPLVVVVAFGIPRAIFIEATLSFIGIGVNPGTPSWGSMVQEGYAAVFAFPYLVIFPAAALALLMLAFTFLGDGLRDAFDPRMEGKPRAAAHAELPRSRERNAPPATIERELPRAA